MAWVALVQRATRANSGARRGVFIGVGGCLRIDRIEWASGVAWSNAWFRVDFRDNIRFNA
jgi:hypothetical protein